MKKQYVWDLLVRLFHWSLALVFVISYATGEEESLIHTYSGYLILGLIVTRIVWGFIGSKHARFIDFIYSPAETIHYMRALFTLKPIKHYIGHNPAGALMVFTLIFSILATIYTGLKLEALEGRGLLAQTTSITIPANVALISTARADDDEHENTADNLSEDFWEEVHEFFANLSMLLVALHIGGVVFSSFRHNENLAKSMITGYKKE